MKYVIISLLIALTVITIFSTDVRVSQLLSFLSAAYIVHSSPTFIMIFGNLFLYTIFMNELYPCNEKWIINGLIYLIGGIVLTMKNLFGLVVLGYSLRCFGEWYKNKKRENELKREVIRNSENELKREMIINNDNCDNTVKEI